MEKITDKIAALPPDGHYFSLEFFPPKTQMVGFLLSCRPFDPANANGISLHRDR
jgi:methylenetetrahydrofolate reductase (NADPH)